MKPKTASILMSAFIFPGLGQIRLGKKRGWIFISGIIILLIWIIFNMISIIYQEMPPERILDFTLLEYGAGFLLVRYRVYHENIFLFALMIMSWLGSIVDLILIKMPENPDKSPKK